MSRRKYTPGHLIRSRDLVGRATRASPMVAPSAVTYEHTTAGGQEAVTIAASVPAWNTVTDVAAGVDVEPLDDVAGAR